MTSSVFETCCSIENESKNMDSFNVIMKYVAHNFNPDNLEDRIYLKFFFDDNTYNLWKNIKKELKKNYKNISNYTRNYKENYKQHQKFLSQYPELKEQLNNINYNQKVVKFARDYHVLYSLLCGNNILIIEKNFRTKKNNELIFNKYMDIFSKIVYSAIKNK